MTREDRIKEREAYLVHQIQLLKQELIDKVAPFARELMDIRDSRRPEPIALDDGSYIQYVGPLPKYLLPEER